MKKMKIKIKNNNFDLKQTFLCGQCFRWKEDESGAFSAIVSGKSIKTVQNGDEITIESDHTREFLENYFDLATDYSEYINRFSADPTLKAACDGSHGIRILRQEPFETLISFIISQNNNIPRIIGIIDRLCESFGEKRGDFYSFPDAKTLSALSEADLAPLRAGFRCRYILDAAGKVNRGEVDLESIYNMDYESGKALLKTIVGVGDKVADCVLLFAYHKTEAFPMDVWIKRITAEYYSSGLPECMGEYKGIAQQYLFEYFRKHAEGK